MAHSYPVLACLLEVALVLDHRLVSHSGGWLLELALHQERTHFFQLHAERLALQEVRRARFPRGRPSGVAAAAAVMGGER